MFLCFSSSALVWLLYKCLCIEAIALYMIILDTVLESWTLFSLLCTLGETFTQNVWSAELTVYMEVLASQIFVNSHKTDIGSTLN